MKRILSIDGGGSRGLFALQIIKKIEADLPVNPATGKKHDLNSYFDLIAGTSTGAIIASLIRWGMEPAKIEEFYLANIKAIFASGPSIKYVHHRFNPNGLNRILKDIFGVPPKYRSWRSQKTYWEPGQPFDDSMMGSSKLKGYLLLVTLRAETLSPWPLTNHPGAKYNDPSREDSNLQIPLWQLVRASSAAPYFFPPQRVWLPYHGDEKVGKERPGQYLRFVDGGVSGYNNPAHLAYRTATMPEYAFRWDTGPDKLKIYSVGTGDFDSCARRPHPDRPVKIAALTGARSSICYLMALTSLEQDMQCRMDGKTIVGHEIDSEIGDLSAEDPRRCNFSYYRYQSQFSKSELEDYKKRKVSTKFESAEKSSLEAFTKAGAEYAEANVKPEHFA